MSDFLKKLNILIKAGMNDVLEDVQKAATAPIQHIPRARLGNNIDNEVEQLRQQINKALDYEDELERKVSEIERDIDSLDRQADEAVANNDDDRARYFVERLQRAQQRKTMLEADINEHRIATQELILRVNELDATIAEARHREAQGEQSAPTSAPPQTSTRTPEPPAERTSIPVQTDDVPAKPAEPPAAQTPPTTEAEPPAAQPATPQTPAVSEPEPPAEAEQPPSYHVARDLKEQTEKVLADVIREARESVARMDDMINAPSDIEAVMEQLEEGTVSEKIAQTKIDDDIAARRARLSGPAKPDSGKKPPST